MVRTQASIKKEEKRSSEKSEKKENKDTKKIEKDEKNDNGSSGQASESMKKSEEKKRISTSRSLGLLCPLLVLYFRRDYFSNVDRAYSRKGGFLDQPSSSLLQGITILSKFPD